MAMVVKNNMSAVSTLNTLNKNNSEMAKSLKKVSSGMKVNGAGDDASAYSISERMRVQIRSLGQCENNTDTGKSMLKTAERAVNEQVNIATKLKENAIKSANDTCTDDDRKIIQKETTQMLMQINAISYETTYNGIQLLTGRELGTTTTYFDPAAPAQANRSGVDVFDPPNGGRAEGVEGFVPGGKGAPNDNYILDLSGIRSLNLPNDLDGQGFSILCGFNCGQFNSFKFDANMPAYTGAFYPNSNDPFKDATIIGIKGLTSASQIADSIFEVIRTTHPGDPLDTATSVTIGKGRHRTRIEKTANGYELKRNGSSPSSHFVLYNGFKGDMVTEQAYHPWGNYYVQGATKSSQETRLQFPNTTLNILFPATDSDWEIDPQPSDFPTEWSNDYANMTPAERNAKWQDEVWPYPRRGALASATCVSTRDKALKFLGDVDQALKYLLHSATTLGAQCQRMDVMNANLVTSDESTQASESLIRDADMAKEMVGYEKNNILTQTAQSALAQANQTSSGILNILK